MLQYRNGKCGFIDKTGKIVIRLSAGNSDARFSEGLAAYKDADKYGYIDRIGKKIIPTRFEFANDFSCGRASVALNVKRTTA